MEDKNNTVWLTRDFEVSHLRFPITVKFKAGLDLAKGSIIDSNTVLTLHDRDRIESAFGYDKEGRAFILPLKCKQMLSVTAANGASVFPTIRDVCKLAFMPGYITNDSEFDVYGERVQKDTLFEVCLTCCDPEEDLLGLSVQSFGPPPVRMMLPHDIKGNFREYVFPYDENHPYVIEELRSRKLPFYFVFENNGKSTTAPTFQVNKIETYDVIYASTYINNVRHVLTLRCNEQITVSIRQILKDEHYMSITEPMVQPLDIQKLKWFFNYICCRGKIASAAYSDVVKMAEQSSPNEEYRNIYESAKFQNPIKQNIYSPDPVQGQAKFNQWESMQNASEGHIVDEDLPPPLPKRGPTLLSNSRMVSKGWDHSRRQCFQDRCMNDAKRIKARSKSMYDLSSIKAQGIFSHDEVFTASEMPEHKGENDIMYQYGPVNGVATTLKRQSTGNIEENKLAKCCGSDTKRFPPQPPKRISSLKGKCCKLGDELASLVMPKQASADSSIATSKMEGREISKHELCTDQIASDNHSKPDMEIRVEAMQKTVGPRDVSLLQIVTIDENESKENKSSEKEVHPQETGKHDSRDYLPDCANLNLDLHEAKNLDHDRSQVEKKPRPVPAKRTKINKCKADDKNIEMLYAAVQKDRKPPPIVPRKRKENSKRACDNQRLEQSGQLFQKDDEEQFKSSNWITTTKRESPIDVEGADNELVCAEGTPSDNHQSKIANDDSLALLVSELGLSEYEERLTAEQVDMSLLSELTEDDLINDIKMTRFDARKLILFVKNKWHLSENVCREGGEPSRVWSTGEITKRLDDIKMHDFGEFCAKYKVDGRLLVNIVDRSMIQSLRDEYGIKISKIEEVKLKKFVLEGWRP